MSLVLRPYLVICFSRGGEGAFFGGTTTSNTKTPGNSSHKNTPEILKFYFIVLTSAIYEHSNRHVTGAVYTRTKRESGGRRKRERAMALAAAPASARFSKGLKLSARAPRVVDPKAWLATQSCEPGTIPEKMPQTPSGMRWILCGELASVSTAV